MNEREVALLRLMAAGANLQAQAQALGLTPAQVRDAKRPLYDKLGVDSRMAALLLAVERGLVALPETAVNQVTLTPRERQVLNGLAQGRSYRQIAESLELMASTVGTYVNSLYRKLGVNNKYTAVLTAVKLGYVTVTPLGSDVLVEEKRGSADGPPPPFCTYADTTPA